MIAILFLPLIVVGDDCYTRTRQKAIDAYNRGEYDYAKSLFQSAKEDCIETPANNDNKTILLAMPLVLATAFSLSCPSWKTVFSDTANSSEPGEGGKDLWK